VHPRPEAGELASIYGEEYSHEYMTGIMQVKGLEEARFSRLQSLLLGHYPSVFGGARRVLDVGCGSGWLLSRLRDAGWQATGVELSPSLGSHARRDRDLHVIVGDVMEIDFTQESFDLITILEVIEHAIAPAALMKKCRGLLASGGAIVVETPNFGGLGARLLGRRWSQFKPPVHLNFLAVRSLEELASSAGLTVLIARSIRPVTVRRMARWPGLLRMVGERIYSLAPRLRLGGTAQMLAVKG